jgi:hypothetical protein
VSIAQRDHIRAKGKPGRLGWTAFRDLFYALLRVVPAAWNGEVVGLYLLSPFFVAGVVVICHR